MISDGQIAKTKVVDLKKSTVTVILLHQPCWNKNLGAWLKNHCRSVLPLGNIWKLSYHNRLKLQTLSLPIAKQSAVIGQQWLYTLW